MWEITNANAKYGFYVNAICLQCRWCWCKFEMNVYKCSDVMLMSIDQMILKAYAPMMISETSYQKPK